MIGGRPKPKIEFLEETAAVVGIRRELAAADRAAGVAINEMRACERNLHYHLDRARELQAMLQVQLDRRNPLRRELSSARDRMVDEDEEKRRMAFRLKITRAARTREEG